MRSSLTTAPPLVSTLTRAASLAGSLAQAPPTISALTRLQALSSALSTPRRLTGTISKRG